MGSRAGNLALALASVVAVLALGEFAVRWLEIGPKIKVENRWLYQASDDPVLQYELRPGAPDGILRISDAGMRDREFAKEKPPGVFRIAAVGDSVTYGGDTDRAQTFAKQLERLLNARRRPDAPRFEVLNFGVPGYNVTQVAQLLKLRAISYQPDVILYGYVLNDLQAFSLEGQDILRRKQREERRGPPASSPVLRGLARSKLFLLGWQQLARWRGPPPGRREKQPDPAYEAMQRGDTVGYFRALHASPESASRLSAGLGEMAAVARGQGVPLLLAVFPLFLEDSDYPLADVHRGVARSARANGFAVADLDGAFRAARENVATELALDFLHPNDAGHRVAAEAMLAALCSGGLLPAEAVDCQAPPGG